MTRRVAIVDDAKFIREALARLLEGDDRVSLVGSAACGEELLDNLDRWRPDVITLDLHMPGMGGLETLDRLMAVRPTPVIILSTHSGKGAPQTLEALSRGAVDFIDKEAYSLIDFHALRTVLLDKILGVAPLDPGRSGTPPHEAKPPKTVPDLAAPVGPVGLIAIGASTGGPLAIEKILCRLPSTLTVPVVIVQHMPPGFSQAFAERLDRTVPLTVREIADGDLLLPGTVAMAPAGRHLCLGRVGEALVAVLSEEPADVPHRPSVDVLFQSASGLLGPGVIGVLLTGMGADGAQGMAQLARADAYTIAQDEASCVVYGMPQAAVALGAVREVVPLHRIAPHLLALLGEPPTERTALAGPERRVQGS